MASYTVLTARDAIVQETARERFALDVLLGLSAERKQIPSKYFYDARGSELFQRITDLDEYYPTACEAEILRSHGAQIVGHLPDEPFNLVELGAGDGRKTRILIESLLAAGKHCRYVPVDISEAAMSDLTQAIGAEYPELECEGLVSDYYNALRWLNRETSKPNLILFLGSNIGNFNGPQVRVFLRTLWNAANAGDHVLIGFDLKKKIDVLLHAYNDVEGLTSAFNLNVLQRINDELGGQFDLSRFEHFGSYDVFSGAMESYLLSLDNQRVVIGELDHAFDFRAYEPIHLEYSYKFLPEDVAHLAGETGFEVVEGFYDSRRWFADMLWTVRKAGAAGLA